MISTRNLIGGLGNLLFKEAYIYAQYRDGNIPDLYLQDEKYFEKYKKEIKERYGTGIMSVPYVAIHVRRGDYVNNDFYVDLFATGYYERAMKEFPEAKFVVFSDDIEWCKAQPIFDTCGFSVESSEVDDLNLMASCNGHIIANSSFSWWGAWLSPNKGKVVAPKEWFTDNVERIALPAHWIRL